MDVLQEMFQGWAGKTVDSLINQPHFMDYIQFSSIFVFSYELYE